MSNTTITITDGAELYELRERIPGATIIVAEPGKSRVMHRPGRAPRQIAFVVPSRVAGAS